ncbi:MAG: lactate utilization protein [Oscillospiraceae bacterium]|nr:lactate utilization protein [Oscillospiraceae bacterium]
MNTDKTINNLKLRGFQVSCFSTAAEAVDYLSRQICGTSVGIGGSKTVDQIGLYDKLCENNEVFWHWKNSAPDTRAKANDADIYISGANAISENGEILNIDGMGNRLAGQIWGHKKVYIISGTNKICPDFESALYRARNTAAVENCKRFAGKQPCQTDGKCHDCRSQDRICRALLVLWGPMMGMETEIVLIDQELGM